jgi:hypothetical protein
MTGDRGNAMRKTKRQNGASDATVKQKSGKSWSEWFEILDEAGAREWRHKQIAAYLREKRKVSPWWSQTVSVGYEHERGIRRKFQKCDGEFSASASRTIGVPLETLYCAWVDKNARRKWLPAADLEVTTTTKNKYFRAKWNGGKSRLSVGFYGKGPAKSQVAVDHEKLAHSGECVKMKAYWSDALSRLQAQLER